VRWLLPWLACAVALTATSSAGAARIHHRHHAHHRRARHPNSRAAIRRALLSALHRNPKLITNEHWLHQADVFDLQVPALLRLNQVVNGSGATNPSDDTATLDFSPNAGGAHTLRLDGSIPVFLSFNGTSSLGFPGDIDMQIPATAGSAPLVSSSIPLSVDPNLANPQSAASPGCGDFATTGGYASTAAGVDDPALLVDSPGSVGSVGDVGPAPYDSLASISNAADVKVRTGPLQLSVVGANNGGVANLFGLAPTGQQPVRLTMNLAATVSTLIRVSPSDATYGALDTYFQCRQFWTGTEAPCTGSVSCGAVRNVFPAELAGTMRMSPSLTRDGRLRLATLALSTPSGQAQTVTLAACLDPYSTLATGSSSSDAFYPAGPSASSPFVGPANASGAPTASCGASGGPLNRQPFSFAPTGQSETLSGQFAVTNFTAELLLGS
jgi:hypothetical protein